MKWHDHEIWPQETRNTALLYGAKGVSISLTI